MKYADLSKELKEEILVNDRALMIAVNYLSSMTGVDVETLAAQISEQSNHTIDCMTPEAIEAEIASKDLARQSIAKDTNGNANGAVFVDKKQRTKKGFRKL